MPLAPLAAQWFLRQSTKGDLLRRRRKPFPCDTIGHSFRHMDAANRLLAIQIGQGAGNLENAMITARGKLQPLGGIAQQCRLFLVLVRLAGEMGIEGPFAYSTAQAPVAAQ